MNIFKLFQKKTPPGENRKSEKEVAEIQAQLDRIEAEMRRIGYWTDNPPKFEVNHYTEAPSFELWLQCIFLPNARSLSASGVYPPTSQVGQMAMRQYDYHSHVPEALDLVELLHQFDRLIQG